jgi:hypothetical protein
MHTRVGVARRVEVDSVEQEQVASDADRSRNTTRQPIGATYGR